MSKTVPMSPAGKTLRRNLKELKGGVLVEVYEKKQRATIDINAAPEGIKAKL